MQQIKQSLNLPAQIIVSRMLCDRPPLTSDIRHVSISSNGTAAARKVGAKLLLSSAESSVKNRTKRKFKFKFKFILDLVSLVWQFHIITYLSTPSTDRTPCTRPQSFMISTWQTNRFDMCIKADAGIIIWCHLDDRNIIAVRSITPKFWMHYNRFNTKTPFKHVKFFQIMISNDQM